MKKQHYLSRLLSVIIIFALSIQALCSDGFSITANAEETEASTEDGFNYTKNDTGITITKYTGSETDITIPDEIDGMPVTTIGNRAFSYNSKYQNIVIPDTVTTIEEDAFRYIDFISINIPANVTYIGRGAFTGCKKAKTIIVDEANKYYDSRNNCNAIIETATDTLLVGCMNTIIPDGIVTIGYRAFDSCDGLTEITIPDSVRTIDEEAFSCTGLTSIVIPEGVTTLGVWAFGQSENLRYVTIPSTVTSIGFGAFANTPWLECHTGLLITNNILYDVQDVKGDVVIPDGVTTIVDYAFWGCSKMTSLYIPDSVTYIGEGITRDCYNLTQIVVGENNQYYDSRDNCNAVMETSTNKLLAGSTNTVIPDGTTVIGMGAFEYFYNLESINIPDSVTSIECHAFYSCTALHTITIPASVTNMEDDIFLQYIDEDTPVDLTIMCYRGSAAHQYALNDGVIKFVLIDGDDATEDTTEVTTEDTTEVTTEDTTEATTEATTEDTTQSTEAPSNDNGASEKPSTETTNKISIPTVTKVTKLAASSKKSSITASWKNVTEADGYQLQISTKKNFSNAATKDLTQTNTKPTITVNKLSSNQKYYVRVRAYKTYTNEDGKLLKSYGKWSTTNIKTKKVPPKVAAIKSIKVTNRTSHKITVSWAKASGATGYQIRISTRKSFAKAKTYITKSQASTYTFKNLSKNKGYYVQIRAYKTYKDENGKTQKVYGKWLTTKKSYKTQK